MAWVRVNDIGLSQSALHHLTGVPLATNRERYNISPYAIITGRDRGEAPLRSVTSFDRSPKFNPTNLLGCRESKQRESHPSRQATRVTFKRPVKKSFKANDKFISHRCTREADDCSGEIRTRLIYDVIIPDFKEPYDELGNTFSATCK